MEDKAKKDSMPEADSQTLIIRSTEHNTTGTFRQQKTKGQV